ncbi:HAMP domain-containing histidine kinase [Sulfurimonas marina]|uniref:histidine kinase n=1 Tax=Sulfurimonas marina TaxID=2590551 RepID=A0A7M1AZL6_9BACT|nr:HAMP domain-containing histidine kinase [Sulfurimonas marina]QOP41988.1 HAMP domain-containing histidine kinase [Sulfurimonas marina]
MNKYSLQTILLIYMSATVILITLVLGSFIISDHRRSLEQNLLYKMHIIAHYIVESKLYTKSSKNFKTEYIATEKNFHPESFDTLEDLEVSYVDNVPQNLPLLSLVEILPNNKYVVLIANEDGLNKEVHTLILQFGIGLLFLLLFAITIFHLLLKKLLYPLKCLVSYCHAGAQKRDSLEICSGSYELNALKDAILNLQQKNQLLCKEKQDIFKEAAHEIKTPISILKARLDLFSKSDMDKEEFLDESNNDINTISNKLRELIFLKAIEWDIQQEKEFVPMQNQCSMMQELFKPILAKKELHMISNLQEDFSLYIHKEAIGRVMQAIFENIFMHTKNGTTINTYVDAKKHQLKIVNEIDNKSDELLFSSHIGTKLIKRLADKLEYTYDAYEKDGLFYTIITFEGQER